MPKRTKEATVTKSSPKKVKTESADGDSSSSKANVGEVLSKEIQVQDHEGNAVNLIDLCQDKGIIIFFYPKANTPGCTKQACGFRDSYEEIQSKDYDVYGMSADSPKSLLNWKTKYNLPYKLLSDPAPFKGLKYFGVFKAPKSSVRSHVVIEKGGKIVSLEIKVSPDASVKNAVATINA